MSVVDRLVTGLVASDAPMQRRVLELEAHRVAEVEAPLARPEEITAAIDSLVGLGPLEPIMRDPAVSDVLVNGPDEIWVERGGALERVAAAFPDQAAIIAAAERVIAPLGLRLDRASPAVDARLADGSRLHAVIPPVAVDGPILAVRRFTPVVPDLAALVDAGSVTGEGAEVLATAVRERRSILVSGGTGAGKTTLLNLLSREIPAGERVVTVEDAAELRLGGHVVRLESRPPNAEGAGEVTMRSLLRHALRLRPDRIVVGEVRGPEAFDMLQAMSTGHDGSLGTIHANRPEEALLRLETLALSGSATLVPETIRRLIHGAIGMVVQMQRTREGRRVVAIADVSEGGVHEVYRW